MKISYQWLKEYLPLEVSPEELVQKLTFSGIEVESVERTGEMLRQITTAVIRSCENHPDSDHLHVCRVDDGTGDIKQVVCGAPNCREGLAVAFAPVGTDMDGFTIKKARIRGVTSLGMICSERELGVSDNHEGILELPMDTQPGQDLASYLDRDDMIYDVEITPNRPDLLGMIGIARDLSALLDIPLRLPDPTSEPKLIDIREADAATLAKVPGIGPRLAERIELHAQVEGFHYLSELKAIEGIGEQKFQALRPYFASFGEASPDVPQTGDCLQLLNLEPERCPRYTAQLIRGVTVKASPKWLQDRLRSAGMRPINNIVDITNFVMLEFGHPLHAFDFAHVKDGTIVVRCAEDGEKIHALDDETYELTSDDLVIADAEHPIAIAGVIGGQNSHITNETTDIVLEAANFLYASVRRTSGRHKIFTDSCYRFERGMSDENAVVAGERAAAMILEIAGGTLCEGMLDSWENPQPPRKVHLRPSRVRSFLDIDISSDRMVSMLQSLGLIPVSREEDDLVFSIPHFRSDLTREIDLIEEIIRLYGYNNVPVRTRIPEIMDWTSISLRRRIEDILVQRGFFQIVTWPFGDPEDWDLLRLPQDDPRRKAPVIANPVGVRFSVMQSILLPNLLKVARHNINHGWSNLKLFQLNRTYHRDREKLATETPHICGLVSGEFLPLWWKLKSEDTGFFDIKGIAEDLLMQSCGDPGKFVISEEPYWQEGQGADILLDGTVCGTAGKVDPRVAASFGINEDVFAFDFDLDGIMNFHGNRQVMYTEIPQSQNVVRDLSIIVERNHPVDAIIETIQKTNSKLIRRIELFDQFTGTSIPENHRSLAFTITLNAGKGTLTDKKINRLMERVVTTLEKDFHIQLR